MAVEFPFDKEYLNKVLHELDKSESEASFNRVFQIKDAEPFRQQALAENIYNCFSPDWLTSVR
jgi:hypothetical protein